MPQKNLTPGYNLQQAQRDIAQVKGGLAKTGVVLPSGYAGFRVITQPADYTTYTVTAGAATQATKSWQIPQNDAQAGTQYRLTVFGIGTMSATTRPFVWQYLGGTLAQCTFPAGTIGSGAFGFRVVAEVTVVSTGTSGTANYSIVANACNANTIGWSINGFSVAATFNTQAIFSLGLSSWWNPNTSGPTMTTEVSMLERLGP